MHVHMIVTAVSGGIVAFCVAYVLSMLVLDSNKARLAFALGVCLLVGFVVFEANTNPAPGIVVTTPEPTTGE